LEGSLRKTIEKKRTVDKEVCKKKEREIPFPQPGYAGEGGGGGLGRRKKGKNSRMKEGSERE